MLSEVLAEGHLWLRVADPAWADPLDPVFEQRSGQRWNPPDSFPALYLNEDVVTARINLRLFLTGLPYGPEDLRDDAGPVLVGCALPRGQEVADVHAPAGVAAVGLPPSDPLGSDGSLVAHDVCQPIGRLAKDHGLRGVRCRSAQSPFGAGRELAWFTATVRSLAPLINRATFNEWFWACPPAGPAASIGGSQQGKVVAIRPRGWVVARQPADSLSGVTASPDVPVTTGL